MSAQAQQLLSLFENLAPGDQAALQAFAEFLRRLLNSLLHAVVLYRRC
jgi:hypothetical protein